MTSEQINVLRGAIASARQPARKMAVFRPEIYAAAIDLAADTADALLIDLEQLRLHLFREHSCRGCIRSVGAADLSEYMKMADAAIDAAGGVSGHD